MDPILKEDLSDTHISRILAEIWQKELSGLLSVSRGGEEKTFSFDRGSLAVAARNFPAQAFLRHLMSSGLTDLLTVNAIEERAAAEGRPVLRLLIEDGIAGTDELWAALEAAVKEDLAALFDWEDGLAVLCPAGEDPGPFIIRGIDIPELVIDGLKRMKSGPALERLIPPPGQALSPLSPLQIHKLRLSPIQRYLYGLLDGKMTTMDILAASDLGEELTCRLLPAFLVLGLAGAASAGDKPVKLVDMSAADIEKVFAVFNNRCAFIFKYLSRELGPVAFSIIEKAFDEVRDGLDCTFAGMVLLPDGRVELKTSLRLNATRMSEEARRSLLKSMDELVMAGVLAVKRTLGPHHEQDLIHGLERIGESR